MKHSNAAAALALVVLVACTSSGAARAQASDGPRYVPPPERCKIVVLDLVGRGLSDAERELPLILSETLATEVGAVSGCDVVSQADITAMLDYESKKASCGDGSDSCLSEVGQALGADRVVAGTLSKLGTDFVVSARLMNVKKGLVEQRAESTVSGAQEALRRTAKNVGRKLFGVPELAAGAPLDGAPSGAAASSKSEALLWTGVAVASVGALAALAGGGIALYADQRLGTPVQQHKDDIANEGLIALAVSGAGVLVAAAGAVMLGVALAE